MLGRPSSAHEQGNRIDKQRLAGAGFSGEHRKSRLKLNVELFYEGKIDNAQLGKHCEEGAYLLIERISGLTKEQQSFQVGQKGRQQGRSERKGEAYFFVYVEPLSDARTQLTAFFTNLLGGAGVLGQELVDHFLELPLRPGANQLFHDLPVFKE